MTSTNEIADAYGRAVALVALDMAGRSVDCPTLCADIAAVRDQFLNASIAFLSNTDDVLMEPQPHVHRVMDDEVFTIIGHI
ncbi:hypothetical protein G3A39_38800 [Paraburkholderia aspalathi]|nr:hypothetical protein [Paraburkholderia aspalathi]